MSTLPRTCTALLVLLATILLPGAPSRAGDFGRPEELVAKATAVYKSFMQDPSMSWFRDHVVKAKGIFIVPQMLRGGFIIGGSGGSGVLCAQDFNSGRWSYPAFYTMGSVSLGLQIGAEASELILLVMTDKGLNAMLSTEFKLGGDVTVAAGPVGGTAKVQTADIIAFGRSQGIFGGVSIEGAVIAPRSAWNMEYYGSPVSPVDILIRQNVANPQADALRNALPKPGPRVRPLGT
ncbi:lipid-binding SYLF domain-containing protein [Thermodesulfobacteriota bacterium B35]